ncbi:MAG TPA: cell division protein FtsA [Bauldia sp.]|nr:cell division protein FtsA [Bauldia sp.]
MKLFGVSEERGRGLTRRRQIVSILDIGSTKICCLIGEMRPRHPEEGDSLRARTHSIEVLGIGHQRSRGIKSGFVANLDAAEQAIRLAVDAAERMAGITVESLIVNLSAGRLASETYSASVNLSGNTVGEADIGRVLSAGRRHSVSSGRSVVHSLPIGYSLDADSGIADPRGMVGERLGVDMHMVTAEAPPLRNLELSINRCHLSIETLVASPYASGLSVLVDDEAELGCACIDFGGGTTTIAVFMKGQFVHVDAIAVGGHHITTDIARGLSTRIEDAERLKTMHGSALPSAADDRDVLSVPPIGDDEHDVPNQVPRSTLTRIIRPRIEEILELVRDRLNASGFAPLVGRRMVLTGGASQLTGLAEAARRILARNVRLGRPLGITGMPEVAKGPAFATAAGLLIYPQVAEMEQLDAAGEPRLAMTGTGGNYFSRVGQWLRESF